MSFAFPDIDPNRQGTVYDVPVPLSRYLDNMYAAGQHDTVLESLNRMTEMSIADADETSPILQTEEANKKWGIGNLKFESPVRESSARIMNQRKRDEMDREFFLGQGASKKRFVPGMAAAILGSISNPVDLGLMFVPFVGEEAVAAKATTAVGRGLARRLVTRETLREVFPRAPLLTESIINGMAGQAVLEVPVVLSAMQDQANYTVGNSLMNIGVGGAFSAAIHGAGHLYSKISRGTKEQMAKQALNQLLRDEPIKVHDYVKVDEAAIWEKIRLDEDAVLQKAHASINMDDIAAAVKEVYGETIDSPAVKMTDGKIETGPDHATILSRHYDKQGKPLDPTVRNEEEGFVTDKGRFISRDEAGKLVGLPDLGYNHLMHENDKLMSEQISTANPEQLGTAEFDRYNKLMEENPQLSKVDALKTIYAERSRRRDKYLSSLPHIQELIERERQKGIEEFIANARAEHEAKKQGMFDAEKKKEIEKQIAAGKTVPPEEIVKNSPPEKFDGSADGVLDEDIAGLQKFVQEKIPVENQVKAIDAAVDCILKKII